MELYSEAEGCVGAGVDDNVDVEVISQVRSGQRLGQSQWCPGARHATKIH